METLTLSITEALDAGRARRRAKSLALEMGFGIRDAERAALATSELAMNLVRYTAGGTIGLTSVTVDGRTGLQLDANDLGPGIGDVESAMRDGFSTGGGLGGGLGGVKRLMDTFELASSETGTRVTAILWLPLVQSRSQKQTSWR